MLRKLVVAVAAGALITTFAIVPIQPADAARKRAKVVRVAPKPAPNPLACAVGLVFLPIKLLTKQPIC